MMNFENLWDISFFERMEKRERNIDKMSEEEKNLLRNPDDETILQLRSLRENETFNKLMDMAEMLFEDMSMNVLKSVMAYTSKKADGYTILDLNGAFLSGLNVMFKMVNQFTSQEIEEKKKEVNEAEMEQIEGKKED